jgi:hypothetical protein
MKFKNVTETELDKALEETNKQFEDNITWNNFKKVGRQYIATLRVKNSRGKGAKRGYTGRHTIHACWHVHGVFFDELLKIQSETVIVSAGRTIDKNGGNWRDWNIGSLFTPLYYSEACACD